MTIAPRRLARVGPVSGQARSGAIAPGAGARPELRVAYDAPVTVTVHRWSAAGRSESTYEGAAIAHLLPAFGPGELCRLVVAGTAAGSAEVVAARS